MNNHIQHRILLGINIDHVATLRNARGENEPALPEAVFAVQAAGADSITVHLREDRRHIKDHDLTDIMKHSKLPLNFEMALSDEILAIALRTRPRSVCLVPERRQEITTEGGLDVKTHFDRIKELTTILLKNEIECFLFLEPDTTATELAAQAGVTGIEFHTGAYSRVYGNAYRAQHELKRLYESATLATKLGLRVHAGHGLNYFNLDPIKKMSALREVNIGHAIISRAIFTGLITAIQQMRDLLDKA